MGVSTAILIGLVYWISQAKVWYGFSIMRMPLSIAPIMGIIFDDMPTALSVGATLQMIYIGSIAPGGNPPADEGLASCIAIPIALTAGIKPEIAISLAIPIGLLGVVLENICSYGRSLCRKSRYQRDSAGSNYLSYSVGLPYALRSCFRCLFVWPRCYCLICQTVTLLDHQRLSYRW